MSLITRCPACETLFKVVPDQLRISGGWVRCGQCDEVFDASAHLVKDAPAVSAPVPLPQQAAVAQDDVPVVAPPVDLVPEQTPAVASQFQDLDLDFSDIKVENTESPRIELDFDVAPETPDEHQVLADSLASDVQALEPSPQDRPAKANLDSEADDFAPEGDDTRSPAGVSFLRTPSAQSAWHRPLVGAGLGVLVLVLLLTLAGQFIFHERDRLVAHEPRLTPWLSAFCAPLGCSLSPVQLIESVVIESSSFARVRGETYLLTFTLKNTAGTPLAMPAVELTLTDALDQPVLRRVVLPKDLGMPLASLNPGLTRSLGATFLVKLDTTSQGMAGYRLLAFYP